jgi:hypothetical protein
LAIEIQVFNSKFFVTSPPVSSFCLSAVRAGTHVRQVNSLWLPGFRQKSCFYS